jgi:hypothetical protein
MTRFQTAVTVSSTSALVVSIRECSHMPPTSRPVTHTLRHQVNVLALAEGFFHTSVLLALLKLGIFDAIGDGERSGEQLAHEIGARPETLARLLNAGVALSLLEPRPGGSYALADLSRATLSGTAEGSIGKWIENLAFFQTALARLDEAVRHSAPTVDPLAHLGGDEQQTDTFILAMHDYAALRGKELARYLDTTGCETLLDLGCGPGTYAFHLGLANPRLHLHLFDNPRALAVAQRIQARYPLTSPVHYLAGDALVDEIPGEYDLVLVSNTLHMLGHEASAALIARLFSVVKPGGSLVIQAQFLRDDRLGDRWPVLLDLIQLCVTTCGANHSVAQTTEWMTRAGFEEIRHGAMSLLNTNSFLRGVRPFECRR